MELHASSVIEFVFSDRNTDSELTIVHNGVRVHIAISADDLARSLMIRDRYLHFLQVAEAYELDGLTVDDFYDWVLEGCAADLSQIPPATFQSIPTLEDYVKLEAYNYALSATEDNELTLRRREAGHELRKYAQIKHAGLDDVQLSQLFGVVHDGLGTIFGLLLTYIDAKAVTLSCAVRPETPSCLRRRWTEQITDTLTRLREAEIVWGDAKPDNVLIDNDDNAWLIDFGGGYTEGWVNQDLAETVQGDQQGLAKIIEYIFQ